MFVLVERPSTTQKFGLLARKNGQYTRPIVGDLVDFRVEDFMPQEVLVELLTPNFIGRLPDIPEIGQTGHYFVATFNQVSGPHTQNEVEQLLPTGQYVLLPHEPASDFWQYSQAPWWEFAAVFDKYNGFIKAPFHPRANEPSADEIDERIDLYDENRGKIQVMAPSTLDKWSKQGVQESYLERLRRI